MKLNKKFNHNSQLHNTNKKLELLFATARIAKKGF